MTIQNLKKKHNYSFYNYPWSQYLNLTATLSSQRYLNFFLQIRFDDFSVYD
jgi:hypothetical protein